MNETGPSNPEHATLLRKLRASTFINMKLMADYFAVDGVSPNEGLHRLYQSRAREFGASERVSRRQEVNKEEEVKRALTSNEGFQTKAWGPMLWTVLMIVAANFPVKPEGRRVHEHYKFIKSLEYILPCGKCRDNLTKNKLYQSFSIDTHLKNRESFTKFIFQLHEEVNKLLGKKPFEGGYEGAMAQINYLRAQCSSDAKSYGGCLGAPQGRKPVQCQIRIVDAQNNLPSFSILPISS